MKFNLNNRNKISILLSYILLLNLISVSLGNNFLLPRLNNNTKEMDTYDINLDLPVAERYKEILIKFTPNIKAAFIFTAGLSLDAKILSQIAEYIIRNPSKYDPEWFEYIEAVSKYAKVSLSEAIVLSINYDIACTSIITQDKEGNIILSRNLDFATYFIISHSIYKARYFKGGKLIFTAIETAGFRGIVNGVKGDKFALSINLRRKDRAFYNIIRVFRGYLTPCYFMYKVLLEADSFNDAYEKLKNEPISAPAYFTLSGVKKDEGVLLTRDYNMLEAEERLDADNGKWFIVVTNHDKDQEDPDTDYRRVPAEKKLKKIGIDNVNSKIIYDEILSQYPNNNLETSFTSIHSAQNGGSFNSTIWLP